MSTMINEEKNNQFELIDGIFGRMLDGKYVFFDKNGAYVDSCEPAKVGGFAFELIEKLFPGKIIRRSSSKK